MSERKYTDENIIKALECCADCDCENCPRWSEEWHTGSCDDLLPTALDLINRQKAEIERLNIELDAMRSAANSLKMHYDLAVKEREANVKGFTEQIQTARAGAIKEFSERLHKGIDDFRDKREMVMLPYTESALLIIERKIDNLVAEMTECK